MVSLWFKSKPLWVQGGLAGIMICLLLTIFYLTFYNWLLGLIFPDGMLSYSQLMFLPMVTGHFFIFMAPLIAKGYTATWYNCISEECFSLADWSTLIGLGIVLLSLYFGIGALVGWQLERRKRKSVIS